MQPSESDLRVGGVCSWHRDFAQHPPAGAEPVAEAFDAVSAQPRRVVVQIDLKRGLVAQRVLHAQRDAPGIRHGIVHREHARAEKPGQGTDLGDVGHQPGAIGVGDAGVDLEVDLVDHRGCGRGGAHSLATPAKPAEAAANTTSMRYATPSTKYFNKVTIQPWP